VFVEVVTTITSRVPLTDDGLGTPDHSVEIQGGELASVSEELAMALVVGGCQATINSVQEQYPRLAADALVDTGDNTVPADGNPDDA
jgi:hypothetical protein